MVQILKRFGGKVCLHFYCFRIQTQVYKAGSQRQKSVFLGDLTIALNQISPSSQGHLGKTPRLERQSSKFHVTSFRETFYLTNKLYCQESVRTLSSLIMQFLSINDIPPVPGETHPCTNRMWQLHHQQSRPHLQFSSEVNASCLEGADKPFKKREASEVSNQRQSDCWGSPKDHPVPPMGYVGVQRGHWSHFHLFSSKYIPVGRCGILSRKVFVLIGLKNFFGQGRLQYIPVQRSPGNKKSAPSVSPGLICNLGLLMPLRQKGKYLFCGFSFTLFEWMN